MQTDINIYLVKLLLGVLPPPLTSCNLNLISFEIIKGKRERVQELLHYIYRLLDIVQELLHYIYRLIDIVQELLHYIYRLLDIVQELLHYIYRLLDIVQELLHYIYRLLDKVQELLHYIYRMLDKVQELLHYIYRLLQTQSKSNRLCDRTDAFRLSTSFAIVFIRFAEIFSRH